MTLVKDKSFDLLGHTLQALSVSSITPNSSAPKTPIPKEIIPLLDSHRMAGLADFLDIAKSSTNRMSIEEAEKKRISRDLHDGLGQLLTSMNLHIQKCLTGCDAQAVENGLLAEHKHSLHALSSMVKQAMNEVRTICSAIRPAILDDLGVVAAVSWQCRQVSQISAHFDVVSEFSIDESEIHEELKTVIYRIVQESLNNALKYSQAKRVKVSLLHVHNAIQLTIRDDGVGFDPAKINDRLGMGLMSMRERAETVDGSLRVNTDVDQGVEISVDFPVKKIALNG
ncbi:MAG: sensor histidine kinase [Candidatus Thiodiazotropha sp.]